LKRQFLLFILLGVARFLFSSYPLQLKTNNLAIYASEPLSQPLTEMLGKLDDNIDAFQMELGVYLDALAPVYLIESDRSYQTLALGKAKIVEFSDAFYSGKEKKEFM